MSDEEKKRDWTYRRSESGADLKRKVHHIICYKGKIIDRFTGVDQAAGERAKKIVDECNQRGVIPDGAKIGADFTQSSRTAQLHKLHEKRKQKEREARNA